MQRGKSYIRSHRPGNYGRCGDSNPYEYWKHRLALFSMERLKGLERNHWKLQVQLPYIWLAQPEQTDLLQIWYRDPGSHKRDQASQRARDRLYVVLADLLQNTSLQDTGFSSWESGLL